MTVEPRLSNISNCLKVYGVTSDNFKSLLRKK